MAEERLFDPARLPMWVIYDHPLDYPNGFVARLWYSLPEPEATPVKLLCPNIKSIQGFMAHQGYTLIPRHHDDDPAIVESWMC